MKKINVLLGVGVLALTLLSFSSKDKYEVQDKSNTIALEHTDPCSTRESTNLTLNEIIFIEEEETIELGFDTAKYLPEGFDAYEGMGLNLNEIVIIEVEEELELGFDTAEHLPLGFNAYEGMVFDIDDIVYIELEDEIELGFDVNEYLPKNFIALGK